MLWWIFKHTVTVKSENQIIELKQKRRFAGKKGDHVIFLDPYDFKFSESGVINDVDSKEIVEDTNQPPQRFFLITIRIHELGPIEGPNSIEDYAYSLVRVRRFDNVEWHFKQQYARISEVEYDAIVKGVVFEARTALGLIVNSLHLTHRLEFLKRIVSRYPHIIISSDVDYGRLTAILLEYLQDNVIPHTRWILETASILSQVAPTTYRDICFREFGKRNKENVFIQAEMIQDSIEHLSLENIAEMLVPHEVTILDGNLQFRFEELFERVPLPIGLQ